MALLQRRPWLVPLQAILVALGVLLLLNQLAETQAPPRNPELMPYRKEWPLRMMGPDKSGLTMTAMGDPIPPPRPGGPFRILFLGSSALRGGGVVPFQSIPGHLQRLLHEEGIAVETINGGAPGSDSGQQLRYLLESFDTLQPDLVVHHGGNNEFFRFLIHKQLNPHWSARAEKLRLALDHLALYRWLAPRFQRPSPPISAAGVSIFALTSKVAREDVPLVEDRYEKNLTAMGRAGRVRGVPVVLSSLAVNEMFPPKDPFPEGSPALQADLEKAFREGRLVAFLVDQVRRHPDQAWARFALGQLLVREGREEEAAVHLSAAVELDPAPVRTLPSQGLRAERAARASGALFLDVPASLRRSHGPILGDQLFLDHCHYLPEANRAVARELVGLLKSRGILPAPSQPPLSCRQDPLDLEAFQGHDDFRPDDRQAPRDWDFLPRELIVKMGWEQRAFQHPAGHVSQLQANPVQDPLQAEVLQGHLAYLALKPELAVQHYRKALTAAPEHAVLWRNLGHALAQTDQLAEALDCWEEFLSRGGQDPHLVEILRATGHRIEPSPGRPPAGSPKRT
ncbi:MAG: hypothetical protein ACOX9B_03435 [Candidatus Xenobium sp.]|jgi:tetratricopeptide (TPR) repeat protein